MVISKEDALFKTRPKPKVNVQLRWISLFSKSSWIKTIAIGLSHELQSVKKILVKTAIWTIFYFSPFSRLTMLRKYEQNLRQAVLWVHIIV